MTDSLVIALKIDDNGDVIGYRILPDLATLELQPDRARLRPVPPGHRVVPDVDAKGRRTWRAEPSEQ